MMRGYVIGVARSPASRSARLRSVMAADLEVFDQDSVADLMTTSDVEPGAVV
jgi:hypothetical protein